MSKPRRKDSVQQPGSPGKQLRIVNIDYDNPDKFKELDLVYSQRNLYDYILYTDTNYETIVDEKSLIDELEKEEIIIFCGFFTDIMGYSNNKDFPLRYNPTMSSALINEKFLMNVPFIVRADFAPKFNPEINSLHLWDGFLDLCNNCIPFHLPKMFFRIKDFTKEYPRMDEDIKKIQEYE